MASRRVTSAETLQNQNLENEELQSAIRRLGIPPNPPSIVLFRVARSRGKDYGCFAKQDIPKGTPLLAEKALFSVAKPCHEAAVREKLDSLTESVRQQFQTLSGPSSNRNPTYFEVFKANSIEIGQMGRRADKEGIFVQASRFNHSCLPNAYLTWDNTSNSKCVTVNAITFISKGEEIFINYIAQWFNRPPEQRHQTREQRRRELHPWGFVCDCPVCQNETEYSQESDRRRRSMQAVQNRIERNQNTPDRQQQPVGDFRALLDLYEQEGIIYPERAEAYQSEANCYVNAMHQRNCNEAYAHDCLGKALGLARQKLELDITCNGYGSPEVKKTLKFVRDLRKSQV